MDRTDASARADWAASAKANRLAAVAMAALGAAVLVVLRPELVLAFVVYLALSVFGLSLVRSQGILVRPRSVPQQNFAAYVALSSFGFFLTLITNPQVISLFASAIFGIIALVAALLVILAIVKSL